MKNGELDDILGIPEMNMKYLIKYTGKNSDELNSWLKTNDISLKDVNATNVDDIIKGAGGVKLSPLENAPYIKNGKPNGRPGPTGDAKLEFEQKVYDAQLDADSILREPYPPYEVIDWKPGDPRKGVVDFGHVEDLEYKDMFEKYKNQEISLEELKKFQSTPENFRIEKPGPNRNHMHEGGK